MVHRDAGVCLKAYARTLRLLHAVTTADRSAQPPAWARVAAESGFFDQSHLVRDFRALCGLTPSQVYRERRAEVVLEAEISNRR
jgi:AraC-like DNA-binding protein